MTKLKISSYFLLNRQSFFREISFKNRETQKSLFHKFRGFFCMRKFLPAKVLIFDFEIEWFFIFLNVFIFLKYKKQGTLVPFLTWE